MPPAATFRPLLLAVAAAVVAAGCQSPPTDTPSADASNREPSTEMKTFVITAPVVSPVVLVPEPFDETIQPGPVTITMQPVLLDDGNMIWMSATEITWDAFDVFVYALDAPADDVPGGADAVTRPSKPYISMDRGFGHKGFPAISMSHQGAEAFCAWLSARSGRVYRLPTEAEWRSACESGGLSPRRIERYAWFADNSDRATHSVANKLPDANGLYDLAGNAAEWCSGDDGQPVTLGGSYRSERDAVGCSALEAPSAAWNASDPQFPKSVWWLADASWVGFRIVCERP